MAKERNPTMKLILMYVEAIFYMIELKVYKNLSPQKCVLGIVNYAYFLYLLYYHGVELLRNNLKGTGGVTIFKFLCKI